jgi:hypothetical protein
VLRAALQHQLGVTPLVSGDHELWFFDLRPYAARLRGLLGPAARAAVRAATLHPLRVSCSGRGITLSGGSNRSPVPATFTAQVSGLDPTLGPLLVRFPDGSIAPVVANEGVAEIRHALFVPVRTGPLQFLTTTSVPASYDVQVDAATLTAEAYQPLMPAGRPSIQAGYPSPTCQLHPGLSPRTP